MGLGILMKLKRNDVEGAVEAANELIKTDELDSSAIQVLLRLQDDPEELERRLVALQDAQNYTFKE